MLGNPWRKLNAAFSRGRRPKGKPSRPDRFRPTVEALEDKALPSISLTMVLPDGSHLRNEGTIPVEFAAGRPDPVTGTRPFRNESPRLVMVGPEGTKSFALIMYDETAGAFVHWAIYNIPVTMSITRDGLVPDASLRRNIAKVPEPFGSENSTRQALNGNGEDDLKGDPTATPPIPPKDVSEITTAGGFGYFGPAPPDRVPHRYVFRLYALRTERLNLPVTADAGAVQRALQPFRIEAVNLTGTFTNRLP